VKRLVDLAGQRSRRLVAKSQEQVFDTDVFVLQVLGQILGLDQQFVQARRHVELSRRGARAAHLGQLAKAAFELGQIGFGTVAGPLQDTGHESLLLGEQGIEQVFGVDLLLAHADGHGLGFA